jgi:hypothetical protein
MKRGVEILEDSPGAGPLVERKVAVPAQVEVIEPA